MTVKRTSQLATSLLLSTFALALFAALWVVECQPWMEHLGVRCDILIGVSYFAICPGLAVLAVIFAARDVVHEARRRQALAAFTLASGLLIWLWMNPPH
jgi:hypothetical protein